MKILKKVSDLEIKRTFVLADLVVGRKRRSSVQKLGSEEVYKKRVGEVKKKVLKMKETQLDKVIGGGWSKRLDAYNNSDWHIAEFDVSELGVWRRAGELPLRWTNRTLKETGEKVLRALNRKNGFKNKRARGVKAIPGILKTSINVIQKEKYLLPIVFKGGTGTHGRKYLKFKAKGDIDDGCMRSIALSVAGHKTIRVYFGTPKK